MTPTPLFTHRRGLLLGLASLPLLAGCSSVQLFDAVVPADTGASLVARDIPFGADPRQRLDIYAPPDSRGLPAILFIYGGSWNSGDRMEYAFAGKALAARGFVVVIADYRLVPQVRFPDFVVDGALALRWMRNSIGRYGGDPRQLFIVGHSAGAYNAVMIGLDPKIGAAAGVRAGIVKGVVGLAGPYDFLPLDDTVTIAAFQNWPNLKETQPISFARASAPPMLLLAGDADTTVYPKNTRALAARLRAAGASVAEKYYPGIGHAGILTALAPPFRGNAPVLDDITAFIKAHAR